MNDILGILLLVFVVWPLRIAIVLCGIYVIYKIWKYLLPNAYFFGLSFLWNSLHVLLLPAILLLYVPNELKNTILGLLTGSGLVIAMIIQPLAGAISDRWASRWGRRRPLILLGTGTDLIFLAVMALAGGIPGLAIGYIGLQFTSNSAHGPAQGLNPDLFPPEKIGRASSVKNVLDMMGMIAASLLMGRFFQANGSNWFASIGIIAAVLVLAAAVTILGTREASSAHQASGEPMGKQLREMFRVNWASAPGFRALILSRFVFLAGVYGVQAFAQYFIRDTLNIADPVKLTGDLMAAIALSLTAFAFGSGWLCDRFGRKPIHILAAVLVAGGSLLMLLAHTPDSVLICGCIIGAGIGVFLTSNWALATDLAPQAEAGKFLGLTNLATAGAGAFSRLMGPVLDGLNNLHSGAFWGYSFLFLSSAAFALLALVVLLRVPEKIHKQSS